MGARNAKRTVKKLKMQAQEAKGVIDGLSMLLAQHGIIINFPWELTDAVGQLLAERTGSPRLPHTAPAAPMDPLLAELTAEESSVDNMLSAPPTNPWAAAGEAAGEEPLPEDPWTTAAAQTPATPSTDPGVDLSEAEIQARFEAGQARMLGRVATEGINYGGIGGAGPAAGQKLAPHDSVQVAPAAPPTPRTDDGTPRGKNGLTREEAVAVIQRATGKAPGVPSGNPTPKPV